MNTKMKQIALPLVVVIAVLLAFSSPAAADYSGDKPLVTYDTDMIKGGIVFETVTDNSTYTLLQAKDYVYIPPPPEPPIPITVPKPNLTQEITISIPEGATVKMARLYNYYTWSTADKGDGSNPGMPAEADIWFDGVKKVCKHDLGDGLANRDSLANPINYGNGVIQYWDSKGQGYDPACTSYARKYDNPYGTFAWDVTDMVKEGMVDGSGTYTAKITNNDTTPTTGLIDPKTGELKPYKYWERFVTWGFGLVVVYEYAPPDSDSPKIQYWIDEGCDLLLNRTCYETAESATTTAPFAGLKRGGQQEAELTTVLMGSDKGNKLKNMVSFNSNWIGPSTAKDAKSIGVNYFDVTPYLIHKDNIAEFQDRSDNVVVCNAFLVVEKEA